MVVHEAVGVAEPVVAFIDVGKDSEECLPVRVILKYSFFVVSPVGDVIHRAGVFDAQRTSHEGSLSEVQVKVKQYRPDPMGFLLRYSSTRSLRKALTRAFMSSGYRVTTLRSFNDSIVLRWPSGISTFTAS